MLVTLRSPNDHRQCSGKNALSALAENAHLPQLSADPKLQNILELQIFTPDAAMPRSSFATDTIRPLLPSNCVSSPPNLPDESFDAKAIGLDELVMEPKGYLRQQQPAQREYLP
ncbi:hypothetical protein Bbelb_339090 [Branchiostoma belcheri]|nr:hypothetical protein Bbelb_339090 [Branchiostoma belcheri]